MIHYILQTLVIQLLFLIVYDQFLSKETFFNWNRIYLLATSLSSIILPLVEVTVFKEVIPKDFFLKLPEIIITSSFTQNVTDTVAYQPSLLLYLSYFWIIGVILSGCLFVYKLFCILKLIRSGSKQKIGAFQIITLPNTNTAFSFFRIIFIGNTIPKNQKIAIIAHEKVHSEEFHSIDLLYFEILRILFWFNPLIYSYQKRTNTLQEYIADSRAIGCTTKHEYYQNLLSQLFETKQVSFINTFFNHSLIKKRILMLQKSKSRKAAKLKYLLLTPVILAMLTYTSCSQGTESDAINNGVTTDSSAEKSSNTQINNVTFGNDAIPFNEIDEPPMFPECKDALPADKKKCFVDHITQFIAKEFDTNIANEMNLKGNQRIYMSFTIDKYGLVKDIKSRAPIPILEVEAKRVIQNIPQVAPAIKEGKAIGIHYSLPILFAIK